MLFRGKLNLCDLAGSEKIHKDENMGQQHLLELKTIKYEYLHSPFYDTASEVQQFEE